MPTQGDLDQSKYQRCGHCGSTEDLETITIPDPSILPNLEGVGRDVILCPIHKREFWERAGVVAAKYSAHPTIRRGVSLILEGLHEMYGLDLEQEDLATTPERVARMYAELCIGLSEDPSKHLKVQSPAPKPPNLVVTRRIDFDSLCIHHLAVMSGYACVGYIPEDTIVGLSKLGRVVEGFAKRPQLQEKMTNEIADCIEEALSPKGVIVLIFAQHGCMCSRGILKRDAETATSAVRGVFLSNTAGCKDEFFDIVKMREAQRGS